MVRLSSLLVVLITAFHAHASKPNIVVILCDDLGYGDVQHLNPTRGKIPTPNMDALAKSGMVFKDAHSASGVCTPTRYGLITGRYSWRTPLQNGVIGGLSPRLIEQGRETVASLLKANGYHTGCIGKWHLGMDWDLKPGKAVAKYNIESREQAFHVNYDKPILNGPNSVGFDYYFGIASSLDMVPYTFIQNDRVTVNPTEDRDFLMMLGREMGGKCRKGPAAPGFEAADVLPTLTKKATEFISTKAKDQVPFFLYLPFASPHTPILPNPEWQGKSQLNPYADFVMATDDAVGKILAALETAKVSENTVVIFTSDNGCSPQAKFPELEKLGHYPSGAFRGTKADIYEGGHHVPFFVKWPGVVKPGSTTEQLTVLNDIMRTCCEIGGAKVPENAGEDSFSFKGLLEGKAGTRPHAVHHSINGSFAIREGDWKLCLCPGSGGWSKPRPNADDTSKMPNYQLFNLKNEIEEKTNLQDKHADVVARLTKRLEEIVAQGRETPGAPGKNAVPVDIYKAGKAAMQPPKKKADQE